MSGKELLLLVAVVNAWTITEFKLVSKETDTSGLENHKCREEPLNDAQQRQCAYGYAYLCNNRGLKKVPGSFPHYNVSRRMCLLDLSRNNIVQIQNYSFVEVPDIKWLYLYDNEIQFIDSKAFFNLTKLLYINLTSNFLKIPEGFGLGVFKPLTNLQYINIKNNPIKSYRGLQELLQPLRVLQSLFISGCYNCTFEAGFKNFTNLRTLSLSGTGPNFCDINILLNNTFFYVPQITKVYLSSCNINKVEVLAFKPLRNIQTVDISYNENLHFSGMQNVLEGLINSSVANLYLDRIYEFYERGTILKKTNIQPIMYLKNLTTLRLDLNKIEVIEQEVFDIIPNKTTRIIMSGNRLTWGNYVKSIFNLRHVRYLDISRQHLNYDQFFREHYEHSTHRITPQQEDKSFYQGYIADRSKNESFSVLENKLDPNQTCQACVQSCRQPNLTCVCIPPKLVYLNWKMSFLRLIVRGFKVCPPTLLKTLDLSFNLIMEWTGPVLGLENLTVLNLAENNCKNMSLEFFSMFNNLQKLNISANFLGPILNPSKPNAGKYFQNLTKLENIDLSENRIMTLSNDIFENLKNLKYLNISRNMLYHWNSTLNAKCLSYVGMSDNRLGTLPQTFRDYLDSLVDLPQKESCSRKNQIQIDLTNNPIQCHCESKPFFEWLSKTRIKVIFSDTDDCFLDDYRVLLYDKADIKAFLNRLDHVCFPFLSVIVSSCICVLSSVLMFFTYRNRWKLRHLYYSKRKRHHHTGYERLFERDAFISYAQSEAMFIKNKLVPNLEREPNALKVWVADRDSLAGTSVAANITHAINNCKKSVLIISKNYFQESWCDYEMNMARIESVETNRKLMIIVLFDDVSVKDIPLDYLRLLKSEQSLDYPSHPQDVNAFWISLAEAIRSE